MTKMNEDGGVEEKLDLDSIVRKVQKLLAKAGNNPSEEEANACTELAQSLLLRYNLDMASIPAIDANNDNIGGEIINESISTDGTQAPWKCSLIGAIARANFCEFYIENGWKKADNKKGWAPTQAIRVLGRKHNVMVVNSMYVYLSVAIHTLCYRHLDEQKARGLHDKSTGRTYAESWRQGCVNRVAQRIREKAEKARTQGDSGSTALVVQSLYEREKAAINQYKAENLALKPMKKQSSKFDPTAYARGSEAGDGISLASQVAGSSKSNKAVASKTLAIAGR